MQEGKKTAEFKAVLPPQIPSGEMDIKIEIKEAQGIFAFRDKNTQDCCKTNREKGNHRSHIREIPRLVFTTYLKDQNNNRILDGGEEVSLR